MPPLPGNSYKVDAAEASTCAAWDGRHWHSDCCGGLQLLRL